MKSSAPSTIGLTSEYNGLYNSKYFELFIELLEKYYIDDRTMSSNKINSIKTEDIKSNNKISSNKLNIKKISKASLIGNDNNKLMIKLLNFKKVYKNKKSDWWEVYKAIFFNSVENQDETYSELLFKYVQQKALKLYTSLKFQCDEKQVEWTPFIIDFIQRCKSRNFVVPKKKVHNPFFLKKPVNIQGNEEKRKYYDYLENKNVKQKHVKDRNLLNKYIPNGVAYLQIFDKKASRPEIKDYNHDRFDKVFKKKGIEYIDCILSNSNGNGRKRNMTANVAKKRIKNLLNEEAKPEIIIKYPIPRDKIFNFECRNIKTGFMYNGFGSKKIEGKVSSLLKPVDFYYIGTKEKDLIQDIDD